jgi:hypothetical protein
MSKKNKEEEKIEDKNKREKIICVERRQGRKSEKGTHTTHKRL